MNMYHRNLSMQRLTIYTQHDKRCKLLSRLDMRHTVTVIYLKKHSCQHNILSLYLMRKEEDFTYLRGTGVPGERTTAGFTNLICSTNTQNGTVVSPTSLKRRLYFLIFWDHLAHLQSFDIEFCLIRCSGRSLYYTFQYWS